MATEELFHSIIFPIVMTLSSITLARCDIPIRWGHAPRMGLLFTGLFLFCFVVEIGLLDKSLQEATRVSTGNAVIGVLAYLVYSRLFSRTKKNDSTSRRNLP